MTSVRRHRAQPLQRPPVGGIGSPPDAMIFYVAHGAAGACGPGCSDWIAAEGTVQWDTHKRLFNDPRPPCRPQASAHHPCLGRVQPQCRDQPRPHPARARHRHHGGRDRSRSLQRQVGCGMLCAEASGRAARGQAEIAGAALRPRLRADAGGRRASQPARRHQGGAERHGPAQPAWRRTSRRKRATRLPERYGEQFRKYLRDMGVEPELLDIVDRQARIRRSVEMPPSEWTRLHIVTC